MNLEGSRTEKARGLALVVLSTVAYGTMPILAKITYSSGVGPAGLLAWRFLLAAGLFALLSRGERPLPFRTRLLLWGVSCVFAANSFAYFRALETLPASRVALLFYVYPVIVTLLSAAMGLEAFTLRGLIAATLAVLGTAFTARGPGGGGSAQGVLFALSAAFCYALFIILVSRFAAGVSPRAAARHVAVLVRCTFSDMHAGSPPRGTRSWA